MKQLLTAKAKLDTLLKPIVRDVAKQGGGGSWNYIQKSTLQAQIKPVLAECKLTLTHLSNVTDSGLEVAITRLYSTESGAYIETSSLVTTVTKEASTPLFQAIAIDAVKSFLFRKNTIYLLDIEEEEVLDSNSKTITEAKQINESRRDASISEMVKDIETRASKKLITQALQYFRVSSLEALNKSKLQNFIDKLDGLK